MKSLGETEFGKPKYEEHESLVRKIREAFLLFYVSSLKSYGECWEKKDGEFRLDRDKLIDIVEDDYKYEPLP